MTQTMDDFITEVRDRLTPAERDTWLRLASDAKRRTASLHAQLVPPAPELHPCQSGKITDQWITATLGYQAAEARVRAETVVLQDFLKLAEETARGFRPEHDDLLREYHERLESLLADVSILAAKLGAVRTAEDAITADRADEWRRLTELAADYKRLRSAQHAEVDVETRHRAAPSRGGEPTASDLHLRNLDDVWTHWRTPDRGPSTQYFDGRSDRLEPWPADPVPLLIWLATSDAQPWIPTSGQLKRLWADRAARANPNPRVVPGFITYANKTINPKPGVASVVPAGGNTLRRAQVVE